MTIGKSILVFCWLLMGSVVSGQDPPDTLWTVSYGFDQRNYTRAILSTADGGFVVEGSIGHSSPEWSMESLLMKVDSSGAVLWQNTFPNTSIDISQGYALIQTPDNGFLLSGLAYYLDSDYADIRAIKTDSEGNMQWEARIGDSLEDWCLGAVQTSDGGFAFCGICGIWPDSSDLLLVKTDSLCNVDWSMTYGGSGGETGYAVQQTADGGYILAGDTESFSPSVDFYIVKTDSDGNLQWESNWGSSSDVESASDVRQTSDGGYLLLGYSDDDGYLVKLDELGNFQWEKTFYNHWVSDFIQTSDGGSIIAGQDRINEDLWLARTDNTGNTVWATSVSSDSNTLGFSVCETMQGGYVVTGQLSPAASTFTDLYLVRFEFWTGIPEVEVRYTGLELYPSSPNPFRNTVNAEYALPYHSDVMITIYDTAGRIVSIEELSDQLAGLHTFIWILSESMPSGYYMIAVEACGERAVRRCVKLD